MSRRYRDFLNTLCPYACTVASTINTPLPEWYIFTIKEHALTHHYHLKSILYIRVRSWWCTFYGFGQMYNDMEEFTALKIPVLHLFLLPSSRPLATTDLLTVSLVLPFTRCRNHRAYNWLLSLSNMHLRFLHIFSWLNRSFLFSAKSFSTA